MKKTIGNVGVLDLTETEEKAVEEIQKIGNVGTVVTSRKTAYLLPRLNIGNIGSTLEVTQACKIVNGQMEISKEAVVGSQKPNSFLINGKLLIKPDVQAEDIERMIEKLVINGQILCTERLLSTMQSKVTTLNGKIAAYPDNARLLNGPVKIDDRYLASLSSQECLFVVGNLEITGDITASLFDEKIANIGFTGKAVVREEYLGNLQRKLYRQSIDKIEIVPTGYTYFEKELVISKRNLKKMRDAKLYCHDFIRIEHDVDEEALRKAVSSIHTKEFIVCSTKISEAVSDLCADLNVTLLDYSGKLIAVDGEYKVLKEELEYSDEKISFFVTGDLAFDKEISVDLIKEKVGTIHNFGEISASQATLGVIQSKLGAKKGELLPLEKGEEKDDENGLGNIGYLKL